MHVRKQYQRGDVLMGGDYCVARGPVVRRDATQKGAFLLGGPARAAPVRYGDEGGRAAIRHRMDPLEAKIKQVAGAVRNAKRA